MKKKIFITENQYNRIFLNEEMSIIKSLFTEERDLETSSSSVDKSIKNVDKTDVKNTIDFLVNQNGYPKNLVNASFGYGQNLYNCVSGNHVYTQAMFNAIVTINNVYIAPKVQSGVLSGGAFKSELAGNMSVCVDNTIFIGQYCNAATGNFYSEAKNFSQLANAISDKTISGKRASDVLNNDTIYFKYGYIQKHINETYASNKDMWNSYLFPDGFWNYLNTYFGTTNVNEIIGRVKSFTSSDLKKNTQTLNTYEKSTSVWEYIGNCFNDYHCALDIASIAVLAIPGVGLALSAGIDFVNASTYGVEAFNAKTKEERDAAIIAGGLTLFGGFLGGGVSQTKRILTKGSANIKVYKYADDVIKRIDNELPLLKNVSTDVKNQKLVKIYKETADKYGLNQADILIGHDIINNFAKIDPKVAKIYSDALTKIESRVGRANLLTVSKNKNFKNLVLQNNGDVVTSLKAYMKTIAGKEALQELGMYVILGEVLSEPEVAKWLSDKINLVQHSLKPTVQTNIKNDGYDWKSTKEIFLSDGSLTDNTLLNNAYSKGWRPWAKSEEIPTEDDIKKSREWLVDNPKFQTKKFKDWLSTQTSDLMNKSISGKEVSNIEMTPTDEKNRKDNVRYVDNKEEMDAVSGVDDGKKGSDAIDLLNQQQEDYLKNQK